MLCSECDVSKYEFHSVWQGGLMFFQLSSHLWLSTGSVRWHFCKLRMLIDNECPWNEIYDGLSLFRETYGAAQVVPLWKRVLSAVQVACNTGMETCNSYNKPIKQVKLVKKVKSWIVLRSIFKSSIFFILKNPEICLSNSQNYRFEGDVSSFFLQLPRLSVTLQMRTLPED